ncbi:MAG: putative ABC transporter permease YknZ [Owenweeksia sp. TMED14]|nr:MAG: putative ABC transporter permease YknZ [Owenweeksia sp. TMED14]|tara:strand:- start:214 stop:1485 length:1272 start_codon:yes stop_codon:yes gene_type:complete
MTILIIAWRNIWRNSWRSAVVIGAMSLGVWSGIFMMGWAQGLNNQRTVTLLDDNVGHGRITSFNYLEKQDPSSIIDNLKSVEEMIIADPNITAYSSRVVCNAMVQGGSGSAPVIAYGVTPKSEQSLFSAARNISSGNFFKSSFAEDVVLGEKLANRLEVEIDDRIILTFQDINGGVHSALFWLVGIYDGASNLLEESMIYVPKGTISSQMGFTDTTNIDFNFNSIAHEVNYRVKEPYQIEETSSSLEGEVKKREIHNDNSLIFRTWKEVSPELGVADAILAQSLLLFMMIILLAMSFGILNTMLMAILERTRELGMLMAVGMNRQKIFNLIVTETILLSFFGLPIGLLFGHISLYVTSKTGITLKSVEQGLAQYGIESTVYPAIVPEYYLPVTALVLVLSFLSALHPARKALKLNPIESMRVL